ncbi:MAG: cation:proton antiporter domain-containing protein [Candidatus Kariarchaeaceae archaeon]|jgi:NhaP-type Na+/H+ or K+/H+ antiporter
MASTTELALAGFAVLLLAGLFSDKLSKRNARFPRLIMLLLSGIILGQLARISNLGFVIDAVADPESVLFLAKLALSLVLFREGLELNLNAFRQSLRSILILSFGAVILISFLFAFTITLVTPLNFFIALLIAGILAPTDPAATFSMFKGGLRLKEKERNIIGSESALNDAVAIVIVTELFLSAAEKGKFVFSFDILASVFTGFFGGIILGYVLGIVFLKINQTLDYYMQTNYLSLVLVVLSFMIPVFLEEYSVTISAAITSLTAGAVFGNPQFFNFPRYEKAHIHEFNGGVSEIGEIVAFGAFGTLFSFTDFWLVFAFAFLFSIITLISRYVVVVYLLRFPSGLTQNESKFIAWGGMRGLATAVLAIIAYQTFLLHDIPIGQTVIKPEVFLSSILLCLIMMTIVQGSTLKRVGLQTNSINLSNRKTDLLVERRIIISKLAFYQRERDSNEISLNEYKELTFPLRDQLSKIYRELQLEIVSRRERMRSYIKELEMINTVIIDLGIDNDDLVQHDLHRDIKRNERLTVDKIGSQLEILRLELFSAKSRSVDKKNILEILTETKEPLEDLILKAQSKQTAKIIDQLNSILDENKEKDEKERAELEKEIEVSTEAESSTSSEELEIGSEKSIAIVVDDDLVDDETEDDNGKDPSLALQKPNIETSKK